MKILKTNFGYTVVEVIFAASIFAVVSVSIYLGFSSVIALISASRDKVAAVDLLNSEFELVRNLPYANVGLVNGIPKGLLSATSTTVVDGRTFDITRTVRNIDDDFDGTVGGSTNDLSPADYKLVQIEVVCTSCKKEIDFSATANVAPKNLESASTNGSLFIRVFDANGEPVPQADVHVENSSVGVYLNENTDNNGLLAIVDAPPALNSYRIIVTKDGYTTDRTYATSTSNPNPSKLDATVILQQLTQISFVIDKTSIANIYTKNEKCEAVANVPFKVSGTKTIGSSPTVYKWAGSFTTNSSGYKQISDLEWDTFSFLASSSSFYLVGVNPVSPISILPDSEQNIDLIISDESPNFLLVKVKDSSSGLPISGASVNLSGDSYNETLVTNLGFLNQTDWSGGSGQLNFSDESKYYSSSGVDTTSSVGEIKLAISLGYYVSSGELVSSIFDTGTSSNWSRVDILPKDQPTSAGTDPIKFQIASAQENTSTTTWNFLGPDGTSATYYTISNNNINSIHNGDRYIRYKVLLNTANTSVSPNISDFAISFSSKCIPPGQISFSDLGSGTYSLEVSASGYSTQNVSVNINSDWSKQDILLSP